MRIVIKLGTSTLTGGTSKIFSPFLIDLAQQVSKLHVGGHEVLIVSSGAIAAGREKLGAASLSRNLPAKQMLAAIGQPRLMAIYEQIFGLYSLSVAQILLTRADLASRRRYLNARLTLQSLLGQGIVPIVNENDSVATDEIKVGDNDNLSALVAALVDADLLILLTDLDGLFTADPRSNVNARLVRIVTEIPIPEALWKAAGGSRSGLGTGGMFTKLQAADLARQAGTTCVIASGKEPDVILRLSQGEALGTRFPALVDSLEARKRYILSSKPSTASLRVDDGAASALRRGSSLLPVGVLHVSGLFERGASVCVFDPDGIEIARGIVNYSSQEVKELIRHRSDEIESILGYTYGDEIIHRNDLILVK